MMNIYRPRSLEDLNKKLEQISLNVNDYKSAFKYYTLNKLYEQSKTCIIKNSDIMDSVIFDNCTIINSRIKNCFVMDGCTINDSDLEDCIIYNNTFILSSFLSKKIYIEKNCKILHSYITDNVHIGCSTTVGPFSHIHTNCDINDNCRIGNFVEIKKSQILDYTKIAHLSYVGDTYLGENVNIGAGTIFCNYDGKNKHQSYVGDNTFIGSNSTIIAPINIGANCMIGANSCVDNDIADDTFFVRRSSNIKSKPNKRRIYD